MVSLQASPTGLEQARLAFALFGWTQEHLACEIKIKTRQPIWRFFSGRPIERHSFIEICSVLSLNWREIATNVAAEFSVMDEFDTTTLDLNALVEGVRKQRFDTIQDQCGMLQLLDINHPVSIDDIYIDVNILSEIASPKWFNIADLQKLDPKEFDSFGKGSIEEKQIPHKIWILALRKPRHSYTHEESS